MSSPTRGCPAGCTSPGAIGRQYQVEALYRGADAVHLLGGDADAHPDVDAQAVWAVAVIDLDDDELDGRVRIEQIPWDPAHDYVLVDPGR